MGTFGDGKWKEGRAGGASLVYVGLTESQLAEVQTSHAAVYIRATLACERVTDALTVLRERNWDLAMHGPYANHELHAALAKLDGQERRGVVLPGRAEPNHAVLYRVTDAPETVRHPAPPLDRPIGSYGLPAHLDEAKCAVDRVVVAGEWAVWRVDGQTFDSLTSDGHKRLLQWLGDHHGRIWCAPVRDIATWRA